MNINLTIKENVVCFGDLKYGDSFISANNSVKELLLKLRTTISEEEYYYYNAASLETGLMYHFDKNTKIIPVKVNSINGEYSL